MQWVGCVCLVLILLMLCFAHGLVRADDALDDVQSGRLIVKLKNAVTLSSKPSLRRLETDGDSLAALSARNGLQATWLRAASGGNHVMQWRAGVSIQDRLAQLRRLRSDAEVEYAIGDRVFRANAVPNDPLFGLQWYLNGSTSSTGTANFAGAWDTFRGSSSVVVAVIDSGILPTHPDLIGRMVPGYDFITLTSTSNDGTARDSDPSDPGNWLEASDLASPDFYGCTIKDSSWHGTFIAGLIAANTNNAIGVAGADWNARILPVRALGKCGGLLSDVVDGMRWAAGIEVPGVPVNANPARVINLSLGGGTTCSSMEQSTVTDVIAAGAVVVAAAGNAAGAVESPARCAGAVAVGAIDKNGTRAAYSALGAEIGLMAPGGFSGQLYGLGNDGTKSARTNTYTYKTGTSFSAPLVAAVVGLMKGANPSLSATQLVQFLKSSARSFINVNGNAMCNVNSGPVTCNCNTSACGAGMLDAAAAVTLARGANPLAVAVVAKSVSADETTITLDGSSSNAVSGRAIASYLWEQLSGTSVMTQSSANQVVTIPVSSTATDLVFKLTVQDSVGAQHSATAVYKTDASGFSGGASSGGGAGNASGTSTGGGNTAGGGISSVTTTTTTSSGSSGGGGGGGTSLLALLLLACAMALMRRLACLR